MRLTPVGSAADLEIISWVESLADIWVKMSALPRLEGNRMGHNDVVLSYDSTEGLDRF